jgi:hypothetical protein
MTRGGRGEERHFTTDHRVLNHATWSPLLLSHLLLTRLASTFQAHDRPVRCVLDGTVERRWGRTIALKGRFHDAVRSQPGQVVTTEGVQWLACHVAGDRALVCAAVGIALSQHADPVPSDQPQTWVPAAYHARLCLQLGAPVAVVAA